MNSYRRWDGKGTTALGRTLVCAVAALFVAGCGVGDSGTHKFSPSASTAREALESALNAWTRGEPPGTVSATTPSINVADSKRPAGQKLARYEIVDETADGAARRFSVRLKLENPAQELATEYVVVGLDPIWVFGSADYAQEKGM
jgi:hypothetical protein